MPTPDELARQGFNADELAFYERLTELMIAHKLTFCGNIPDDQIRTLAPNFAASLMHAVVAAKNELPSGRASQRLRDLKWFTDFAQAEELGRHSGQALN